MGPKDNGHPAGSQLFLNTITIAQQSFLSHTKIVLESQPICQGAGQPKTVCSARNKPGRG
jgi:hypothetical protein